MGLTEEIFAKRGSWQLFRSVAGYDLSAADSGHVDKHGRLWLRLNHVLLCTDGRHVMRSYDSLPLHGTLPNVHGFAHNDLYWSITNDGRLLALDLETGEIADHTQYVPDLHEVYALWRSPHDDIMLGYPGSLVRYNMHTGAVVRIETPDRQRIRCAGFSPDGDIWITTEVGLYTVQGDHFRHCPIPGVNNRLFWDFLAGPNKTLWLPLPEKLLYLENGCICDVLTGAFACANSSSCLRIDRDNNVWIAMHYRGVMVINRSGMQLFPFEDTPGAWWPKCLVQDATGAFWQIGVKNGVLRYDPRGMDLVQRGHVEALVPMKNGHFVMAAASRGLLDYDGNVVYQVVGSLPSRIYSLFVDTNEDIYICAANGVYVYDSRAGTVTPVEAVEKKCPSLRFVDCVVRDRDGLLWVNPLEKLLCVGPDGVTVYPHTALNMERRLFMFCDDQGVLWLVSGHDQPVLRFRNGAFEVVQEKLDAWGGGKPHDRIFSMTQDEQGTLWAGTRAGWIFRFSSTTGAFTREPVPGISGGVRHVRQETSGEMWICTTNGLFRHDGRFTYRMTEANLLPSHRAVATYRINDETVLIATELGICRYHPRYDVSPDLFISKVTAGQDYDSPGASLTCEESGAVSVHLAAWNVKPGPLVYRYRLLGHQDEWKETTDEVFRFQALPVGTYRFEAEAYDQDLVFSREQATLEIVVTPNAHEAQIAALEGELEDARAYAENILRSMHEMVVVLDVDGVIITVNPAMTSLLGYSAAEAIGQTPGKLFFQGQRCPVDPAGLAKLREVGYLQASEVDLYTRGGTWLPVILSAFCLHDPRGVLQGFVVTASDISEHKEVQRLLLQSQKMESLGLLAGGIAHDFNNLLGVMIGNADILLADMEDASQQHKCLADIIGAGKQAAKLCAEMLTYCGKGSSKRTPLDLSAIVRHNTDLLKSSISRKVTITYAMEDGLPLIMGDEVQIMQIVMNLVMNASEAIGDQTGSITLRTRLVRGALDSTSTKGVDNTAASHVLLQVSDTGHGMDDEMLARIFEPFFTTKFTGRGLGLSAIHGIVKSHNGELKVHSVVGKGTTFDIYLPVTDQQDAASSNVLEMEENPTPGVALLVDDEETVRKLVKRMLRRLGFDDVEAVNGADALEKLKRNIDKISVVLLDITMPVMGGDEAYVKIRALCPALPVVVMSGYSELDMGGKLPTEDRYLGVLQKPFTAKDLAAMIVALESA